MPPLPRSSDEWLKWGGLLVAAALFVTFMVAAFNVISGTNDPPLLSDPAPTAAPVLLCPGSSSSPTQTSEADATSTSTLAPSSNATSTVGEETATSQPTESSATTTPAPVVTCAAGEVAFPPQYRGGYDPNTRLMALLAIVVPLLTTIVAFYFGQKAGAGASEAEKEKVVAQVQAISSQGNQELTDLQELLKKGHKL